MPCSISSMLTSGALNHLMLLFITTLNGVHIEVSILVIFLVLCNHHQGVYLLFNWMFCQVKCLVCKARLNVSEIDISVSHQASLNPGNNVDMPVYAVRANVSKDCSPLFFLPVFLFFVFYNSNTDLIREENRELVPTPSSLCSRVPWGWGSSEGLFLQ